MIRPSFHNILMNMALLVAQRSTCTRGQVGTVISSHDFRRVLAMGYNGNATGLPNGCDRSGPEAVGACGCLHSEENAAIACDASRAEPKIVFATILPCVMCAKRLLNLGGVGQVFYLKDYRIRESLTLLRGQGVRVSRYTFPTETDFEAFTDDAAVNDKLEATSLMGEGERHRYETRHAHGEHPAGSTCWVSRNARRRLVLEFYDGTQIELDPKYYARGIEEPEFDGDAEVLQAIEDAAIFLAV